MPDLPIQIQIVVSSKEEAKAIALSVITKKLAISANFFNVNSIYNWEDVVEEAEETILFLKSYSSKYEQIEKEIKKIHCYENPEIFTYQLLDGNKDFLTMMEKIVLSE